MLKKLLRKRPKKPKNKSSGVRKFRHLLSDSEGIVLSGQPLHRTSGGRNLQILIEEGEVVEIQLSGDEPQTSNQAYRMGYYKSIYITGFWTKPFGKWFG